MARPHPALLDLAAGRPAAAVTESGADDLVRSALEHHMFGLLWTEVSAGRLHLPRPLEQQLAVQDLLAQARHELLWRTIGTISEVLGAIDVEFAVIKGVPSEARWYDRVGERPCADVDVYVSPADAHRAAEIIRALDPAHRANGDIGAEFERGIAHGVDLVVGDVAVDLHLDPLKVGLLGRGRTTLWERTTMLTTTSTRVRVLDAEAALFHLLVVMNKDGFCRLLAFSDVARLVRRETIDWEGFAALSESYGLDVVARSTLLAVADTVGVDVPLPAPRGVRAAAWRALWPPSVRLQGELGWVHFRRRVYVLPLLAEHRKVEAFRWWWRRLVLARSAADRANPGGQGPWVWRIWMGRFDRWRRRRATIQTLRRPKRAGRGLDR